MRAIVAESPLEHRTASTVGLRDYARSKLRGRRLAPADQATAVDDEDEAPADLVPSVLSDWSQIDDRTFTAFVESEYPIPRLVSGLVLERLPYAFGHKLEYFGWRDALADGLHVDSRDVVLVGSAATGRSLNAKKQFKVFNTKSDLDIAVVSQRHFEECWNWMLRKSPTSLGLDDVGRKMFDNHRSAYVYDGMIAANYFLSYFDFGARWLDELQRCESQLPSMLQGRFQNVRIYKDSSSLRRAQATGLISYRGYLANCK